MESHLPRSALAPQEPPLWNSMRRRCQHMWVMCWCLRLIEFHNENKHHPLSVAPGAVCVFKVTAFLPRGGHRDYGRQTTCGGKQQAKSRSYPLNASDEDSSCIVGRGVGPYAGDRRAHSHEVSIFSCTTFYSSEETIGGFPHPRCSLTIVTRDNNSE